MTAPHRPFYELLGLQVDPRTDRATVHLPYRDALANSRGAVHGGASMTLLDATLARAVRLHDPAIHGAVTIDITTHFLEAGHGDLAGTGRVVSFGRTIAVAEAEIHDMTGACVARATGTFRIFTRQRNAKEVTDAVHR